MIIRGNLDAADRERIIVLQKKLLSISDPAEIELYNSEFNAILQRAKRKARQDSSSRTGFHNNDIRVFERLTAAEKNRCLELQHQILASDDVLTIDHYRNEYVNIIKRALQR